MKILYIHQYFKTPLDPGGTRSYWFARELIKNGHSVTMLTSRSKQDKFIERLDIDGIETIYIRSSYSNSMGIVSRLWSFFRFMIFSTWMGLREKKVDMVYATSTPLSIGIPALLIKWIKGINFIFEVRDLWPEVPIQMGAIKNKIIIKLLYLLERTIYHSASHVVALSPGMRQGVLDQGVAPGKVTMIPNMSKKDEFYERPKNAAMARQFGIDLNCFNALHFGAMGLANGLEYIIEAAARLKERGHDHINILFLGSGKTEVKLKEKCRLQGLTNVKFLGEHPMQVVSEIVNICDCSIVSFADIPILYTNSPNKLFDSLSAARPVIVNSPGWTKEMVEEHHCGLFTDPKDPGSLADALISLVSDKTLLVAMGRNGRRLAEEVYDKSILCKQFSEVIGEQHV